MQNHWERGIFLLGGWSHPSKSWAGLGCPVPPPGTHLQLLELLQLVAEVAGVLLQVVEVQLHVQAGDGRGLPRRRAGGGGRRGRGHRCPHAAATGGCGEGKAEAAEGGSPPRGGAAFPGKPSPSPPWASVQLLCVTHIPPRPCWLQGAATPDPPLSGAGGPPDCQRVGGCRPPLLRPPGTPAAMGRGRGCCRVWGRLPSDLQADGGVPPLVASVFSLQ